MRGFALRCVRRHRLRHLVWVLPATLGLAAGLAWFNIGGGPSPAWGVRVLAAWAALASATWSIRRGVPRRDIIASIVLGVPMAVARLVGAHFVPGRRPPFTPWSGWTSEFLVDAAACILCTLAVLDLLSGPRTACPDTSSDHAASPRSSGAKPPMTGTDPATPRPSSSVSGRGPATVLAAATLMLLAWTPYFVVFRPGIVMRDSWSSISPWLGQSILSNHHPVLFSLWVGACIRVASMLGHGLVAAVMLFSASQAILLSCGLGLVVRWMARRFGRWPAAASTIYFAVDPHLAMWSITMDKDVVFVLMVTLLGVLLAECQWHPRRWVTTPGFLWRFALLGLLVSFTRNNGPYVFMGVVAVLVIDVALRHGGRRPERWWRVPLIGVLSVVAVLGVQGPGYRAAGVAPSPYVESVGVPLQQVAWAVTYGHVSPADAVVVDQIMAPALIRKAYSPTLVDNLKFAPHFDGTWISDHRSEFRSLWVRLGAENPTGYLLAWYALDGRYLDPGALFLRVDPGTTRGRGRVSLPGRVTVGDDVVPEHLRAAVAQRVGQVESAPGVNVLFRLPLLLWWCVAAMVAAGLTRRVRLGLAFLPHVLVVGSLLVAAPMTDFRYAACLHVALPVLVALGAALARPSVVRHTA